MHSKIFVLVDKNIDRDDLLIPDYEDVKCIADYVENSNLEDDIIWLGNTYEIDIKKKDGKFFLNREEFLKTLMKEKTKSIENAKKLLDSKPVGNLTEMDIYKTIKYLTDSGSFLFAYNNNQYLESLIELFYEMESSAGVNKEIEIVASYDYHFWKFDIVINLWEEKIWGIIANLILKLVRKQ